MSDDFMEVIENVELLLLELKTLKAEGPHFKLIHRFRQPGSECAPGEEVAAVYLVYRARDFLVPLSCSLLLVFDYLSHHSHLPQTASQIVAGMRADSFYQRHGRNAVSGVRLTRKISRSSLKEYVKRLRIALAATFDQARLHLDPYAVLLSEETSSNQAAYRLRATFEIIHVNHPGHKVHLSASRDTVSSR